MTHLHIGHHFFGAGNFGDELMLAGFLTEAKRHLGAGKFRLTCSIPFDLQPQRKRFPQVEWLPYDTSARRQAIAECDAWVGVGDSPFQADASSWFLDHLLEEQRFCEEHRKPMYFLGVGVNTPRDAAHGPTKQLVQGAVAVWTRDPLSAELLRTIGGDKVISGNDLSHAYLSTLNFGPSNGTGTGFVLNFEDESHYSIDAICAVLSRSERPAWLMQEVRELPGSEQSIYKSLPADIRARLPLRVPDYANASTPALIGTWGAPRTLVTSRFHATIVAGWAGWNIVCVERGTKVTAIANAIGAESVADFTNAAKVVNAVNNAQPAPRKVLHALADDTRRCCDEFFARV